ncbi:hypothetical protein NDA12_007285 [Ustilago hordei]|nr:hypothetical protein NDA12_007285 [Ustilago hordei]
MNQWPSCFLSIQAHDTEQCIGHWQAGPEEEEQCRRSRHQVMRRRSSVEGVDTTQEAQGCQAGEAPEQYSMKKILSGERAGAASLAKL